MSKPRKAQRPAGTGRSGQAEQQGESENKLATFWRLVGAATRRPEISKGDLAVLWAILQRVGDDGTAWPGYGRIANDTGLNRSTVTRSIRKLVSKGLLERESGGPGRSNRYRPGRCTEAPRRTDAPRRKGEPRVGARTRLGVGAATRPESASFNQPNESALRTRTGKLPAGFVERDPRTEEEIAEANRKELARFGIEVPS